jgi:hypothetical protein
VLDLDGKRVDKVLASAMHRPEPESQPAAL